MNSGKKYHTKQREQILECIREDSENYITIHDLSELLAERGVKVGLTTIYRTLDELEKSGQIAKVSIDGINGTCYKYLAVDSDEVLFYLKCEKCGKLVQIDCPELAGLYKHLSDEHHVSIDAGKTMFYGICGRCDEKNKK